MSGILEAKIGKWTPHWDNEFISVYEHPKIVGLEFFCYPGMQVGSYEMRVNYKDIRLLETHDKFMSAELAQYYTIQAGYELFTKWCDVLQHDLYMMNPGYDKEFGRTAGLSRGTMVIAEDFDDELPTSFWTGEDDAQTTE